MNRDRQLQEIEHWAKQMSWELLGKPVAVSFLKERLGRTRAVGKQQAVEIEISPAPIIDGHPHGMDITRGLVLHELGHHLVDIGVRGFGRTRGVARAEGIGDIYDILCDERLERRLRSHRPQWGVYFDRLVSYAFSQNVHEVPLAEYAALLQTPVEQTLLAVQRGDLPGQLVLPIQAELSPTMILRDADMLALPGITPLLMAFLACLRCGMNPHRHPDPRVAEAIARVPSNLKQLSHTEVLQAARAVAAILGGDEHHQREEQQLRQRMRTFPNALRGLAETLERLEQTKRLPRQHTKAEARRDRTQRNASTQRVTNPNAPNLNPEEDFPLLTREETLPNDPALHTAIVRSISHHIRRLRNDLKQLGMFTIDEYASRSGRRLDLVQARKSVYQRTPNLLVSIRDEIRADTYIGVVIDRSDSMAGYRLDLAKALGVLVAESAKGVNGIEGHVNAFNDDTWSWLGNFQRSAIASLTTSGSNNDAAALARAAQLALHSRKRHKLLVMISDATPSACTFASLQKLVTRLTRDYGILCAQVAVAEIEQIAFPHHLDVSHLTMDEAVTRFGELLMRLVIQGRE